MVKKVQILLLLSLVISSNALFEDFPLDPIQSLADMHQIVLNQIDHSSMVVFWNDQNEKCQDIQEVVKEFVGKTRGFFKVFSADCEEIWTNPANRQNFYMCNPTYLPNLPLISFFEPANGKLNPTTNTQAFAQEMKYTGPYQVPAMIEFGQKFMPAYRDVIQTYDQFQKFRNFPHINNKVALFTKRNQTTTLYQAITAEFRGQIKFGEIMEASASPEILEKEEINRFPSLMVYQKSESGYEKIRYEGELQFKYLKKFLQEYAAAEKYVENVDAQTPPPPQNQTQSDQQNNTQSNQTKTEPPQSVQVLHLDYKKHDKAILKEEQGILIHIRANNQERHPHWDGLTKKLGKMFLYYDLVADTPEEQQYAEKTLGVGTHPNIRFFPFGTAKKGTSKVVLGGKVNVDQMIKAISQEVPDSITSVGEQNLQTHIDAGLRNGKLVNILFHNKEEISLSYRAMALHPEYREKFSFLHFRNPAESVQTHFQITTLPKLHTLFREADKVKLNQDIKPEQVKLSTHHGPIVFNQLAKYSDGLLETLEGQSSKPVVQVKTQSDYNKICRDRSSNCYIAILNGSPENRAEDEDGNSKLKAQIKVLERVKDKFGNRPITFGWIDGICQRELLRLLQVQEDLLPKYLSVYNNRKSNQKTFSLMFGTFDFENLSNFMEKSLKGHVELKDLPQQFEIQNQNCDEQHSNYNQSSSSSSSENNQEQDQLIQEIREEERKRKEEAEQILQQEKSKQKDKKKQKSKQDL